MFLNKKLHSIFTAAIFALSLLVTACSSLPKASSEYKIAVSLSADSLVPEEVHWEHISAGIVKTDFFIKEFNSDWTCVKIDLSAPNLTIVNYPQEALPKSKTFRVKTFAKNNNTVVAVNTTPFDNTKAKTYNPIGIIINEGQSIYPAVKRDDYAALAFYKDKTGYSAKVVAPQNLLEDSSNPCVYAAGGFFPILQDGNLIPHMILRRSRTVAGVSQDGKTLFLFAVTSRNNPKDNKGLSYDECALILQKLGCSDAMNFDGGHSTALCLNAKYARKPSLQRKIPAALGIKFSE